MIRPPYGAVVAEHFRRPLNRGPLPSADCSAEGASPVCGDRVRIALALTVDHQHIADARFTGDACAICVAAASLLTEHLRGKAVADVRSLTAASALALLGSDIPAARRGCATLPLEAAQRALASVAAST